MEITFRVKGLEGSQNGSDDPGGRLVRALQELEGVLAVRYDPESRRFGVSYNPNQVTVLRIISRIEFAGQEAGLGFRPTDVQTAGGDTCASRIRARVAEHVPAADRRQYAVPGRT